MKKLINLGKPLNRVEQKAIYGGTYCSAHAQLCDAYCECGGDFASCFSNLISASCWCDTVEVITRCY